MTAPSNPAEVGAQPRSFWLHYDHQAGQWRVDDRPPSVIRAGAEVIHVVEVAPSPPIGDTGGVGEDYPRVDGKIAPPVEIGYTNYRGEFAVRCIVPVSFWYGSTDWHPEPQWLVKAWDADKGAERDFAFKDFSPPASPSKPEEPAPVPIPEPQAVAWRYRYEETGEDNEMIWSDWIVVKWKPNRSVFSTKVEIDMDRDNLGNPLPDDAGVGWVYLTQGDFRRAKAALDSGSKT